MSFFIIYLYSIFIGNDLFSWVTFFMNICVSGIVVGGRMNFEFLFCSGFCSGEVRVADMFIMFVL